MTQDKASDPSASARSTRRASSPETALDRRKAALKANMARRKGQAQARAALASGEASAGDSGQEPTGNEGE